MTKRVIFRCYDCPKHTGVNGIFETLNEALEHMRDYPQHILNLIYEEYEDEDD